MTAAEPATNRPPRLTVLFACVGNSARSQMAAGFARALGGEAVRVMSGGSKPLGRVLPGAVAAMAEHGIDISKAASQGFDEAFVRSCDVVVTMGCGDDACPAFAGKRIDDWQIPDPAGRDQAAFGAARDEILARVRTLLAEFGVVV